jgi:hypothetical protein
MSRETGRSQQDSNRRRKSLLHQADPIHHLPESANEDRLCKIESLHLLSRWMWKNLIPEGTGHPFGEVEAVVLADPEVEVEVED